ncbi:MAG: hypothetical protein AAGA60_13990 [Cyanobacteria bacterium P01_E01_bin.42]
MASIAISVGDAFLIDTPPNAQHLYIAIAQISETHYLFVNVTSRPIRSDTSCILQPGEGIQFIKRESFIAYKFAREMDATQLATEIMPNSPIPKEIVPPDILSRIQQGGLKSKLLKNRYKKALKAFLDLS